MMVEVFLQPFSFAHFKTSAMTHIAEPTILCTVKRRERMCIVLPIKLYLVHLLLCVLCGFATDCGVIVVNLVLSRWKNSSTHVGYV